MNDEKALMVRQEITPQVREITLQEWQLIQSIAPVVAKPKGLQQEQAALIMATGYEIGFKIIESLDLIEWVEGKMSLKPKGQMALVHASQIVETKLTRLVDKAGQFFGYKCWMRRKDSGFEFERSFTLDDAKRAELTEGSPTSKGTRGRGGYEKYPENLCMWRAIGFCADVVLPTSRTLYYPEELGANVNESGEPVTIKGEYTVIKDAPKPATPDLAGLFALFSPERVLAANGGVLPTTQEQVEEIIAKLSDEDNKTALAASREKGQ